MSESRTLCVIMGTRDRKPHPDAFWSDKWGWLEEATVADLPIVSEVALDILEVDEDGNTILELAAHDLGIEPGVYALIPVAALGGTTDES